MRTLVEVEADLANVAARSAEQDIARFKANVAHEDAMRDCLQRMTRVADVAVTVAVNAAARIDCGVYVVAKQGAATETAAVLHREFVAAQAAGDALKAQRAASNEARWAELNKSQTEYAALRAEADEVQRRDEAQRQATSPRGRAFYR